MSTNQYISWNDSDEQNLIEDLMIETIQFYGQDIKYLPREIVNENTIFNEVTESKFDDHITVEIYQESTEAYEGDGELFSKFGLELRNSMKVLMSVRRFREESAKSIDSHTASLTRPREGDLVFHANTKGLYEIKFVDPESFSFYALGKLPVYRLTLELFEYSGEDIDTGLTDLDEFQSEFTPQQTQLNISGFVEPLEVGSEVTFTNASAKLLQHNIANGDIAIGPITFDDGNWRIIENAEAVTFEGEAVIYGGEAVIYGGESITIGTETGVVNVVYDTLREDRFNQNVVDQNDDIQIYFDSVIDTSRPNSIL
jgi:hypothetical protein